MLLVVVWILSVAAIAGTVLALWHLRATDGVAAPPVAAGLAHGGIGIVGVAALLLILRGPTRAVDAGAGSFGTMSAVLLVGAVLTGISIPFLRRKAIVMAIHAGIAVTGYVLLLAWNSLG